MDDGPPFLRDGYDPEEQPGFTNLDNESTNVLTTQDIPSQVQACNLPTIAFLLRVAFRQRVNRTIPYELVEMILGAIRESGTQITREEAEKRRRSLMEERLQTLAEENQVRWSISVGRLVILTFCSSGGRMNGNSLMSKSGMRHIE